VFNTWIKNSYSPIYESYFGCKLILVEFKFNVLFMRFSSNIEEAVLEATQQQIADEQESD